MSLSENISCVQGEPAHSSVEVATVPARWLSDGQDGRPRGADLSPKQAETESTRTAPSSLPPDWDVRPTVLDSLRRYWWLVCLIGLIGAGLGIAYAQLQRDPVYTADA